MTSEILATREILENLRISEDHVQEFDAVAFAKSTRVEIVDRSKDELEFDLVGVDASFANALRRILLSEIPTMAIEKVYFINNTSVVHDEILAHRLGLVPIYADPKFFSFRSAADEINDQNTIVFELKVKCEKSQNGLNVYSDSLKWIPQGAQTEYFKDDPIRPVLSNILLAKLRPGQEISLEAHCEKNIGREHAKWSPVATATYRLLPTIDLKEDICGDSAYAFAKCFPPGVVVVEKSQGMARARIADARKDTVSRECLQHAAFADKVLLGRKHDHFIFHVESTGIISPEELVNAAFDTLRMKCDVLLESLDSIMH